MFVSDWTHGLYLVVWFIIRTSDSSSGVSDQQSVGSSAGRGGSCVLDLDLDIIIDQLLSRNNTQYEYLTHGGT